MASYFQFQINRNSRRLRRNVKVWRSWFLHYSQRHVFGGWQKLGNSKEVFLLWALVVGLSLVGLFQQSDQINSSYLAQAPTSGGIYAEALSGSVKGVNPVYPDNSATTDVSAVVFSGLTKVDSKRQIAGDLASSWEISPDKKTYTFKLRPNIKWHDGVALTSEDVIFTISRIQNPDTRSPLASNWLGVKAEAVDASTVRLSLPSSYSPFLFNTTVGIIPRHILDGVRPSLLKTNEFNQKPIGTGPFKLREIKDEQDELVLDRFDDYYLGRPYLEQFRFVQYQSSDDFLEGYLKKQINGFAVNKPSIEQKAKQIDDLNINHLSVPAYGALFFNIASPAVSDVRLRTALAYATNKNSIVTNQLDGQATKIDYPILAGYAGFDSTVPRYDFSQVKSREIISALDAAQIKNTKLRIVTSKDSVYEDIAYSVKEMWSSVGVESEVIAVPLDELQQNFIRPRNYDVLLFGQDIGIDSDVYAYWHSSQVKDPGLNLSQYANPEADRLLETGRTAKDAVYQNSRYAAFQQLWAKDVPAVVLYTPYYNYAQNDAVGGLSANKMVEPSNRFLDAYKWFVQTKQATKASIK